MGIVDDYVHQFVTGAKDIRSGTDWNEYLAALDTANLARYIEVANQMLLDSGYFD